jgi:serine kinase of HPr protein (carbohydrate metabolism regulator)
VPGLFGVASMREGMRLDLIIRMQKSAAGEENLDRTGLDTQFRNVLGIDVPLIAVPVAAAATDERRRGGRAEPRMKQMGHDAPGSWTTTQGGLGPKD